MLNLNKLIRPHLQNIKPYASARMEYQGKGTLFLDANENALGSPFKEDYSKYPDPLQKDLREELAELYKVSRNSVICGNGSDELIDLIIRTVCEPESDEIIIMPPTYGMYKVCANINNVKVVEVSLTDSFDIDIESVMENITDNTKIIFICSPNNPTGNSLKKNEVEQLIKSFNGIVVMDEAYVEFSRNGSVLNGFSKYDNLVLLRTFSKAWGLAGIRLGIAIAHPSFIAVLDKIKAPYNVNSFTQEMAIKAIHHIDDAENKSTLLIQEREKLNRDLKAIFSDIRVFPSDANFILVRFRNSQVVFRKLIENGIIVRDRSKEPGLKNCLRITVGSPMDNAKLISVLRKEFN